MPIFDYKCDKCGVVEEKLVRITDDAPFKCGREHCSGEMHKQVCAPGGIDFGGVGNYSPGYKHRNN